MCSPAHNARAGLGGLAGLHSPRTEFSLHPQGLHTGPQLGQTRAQGIVIEADSPSSWPPETSACLRKDLGHRVGTMNCGSWN